MYAYNLRVNTFFNFKSGGSIIINMSLKDVIIELRHNLKCANVFLAFLQTFSDNKKDVSVIVRRNRLIIKCLTLETEILLDQIEIDIHSLSALVVEENCASFRISLSHPTDIVDILVNGNSNFFRDTLKINIVPTELYNITCKTCQVNLMQHPRLFNRVLELPSGSIEINDWFCHSGPNYDKMLIPKEDDIFYGFYYIVLNRNNMCNYKCKDVHIYCNRCLQYLGEVIFSEMAIKIWSDNVIVSKNGNVTNMFKNENADEILYNLIKNTLIESNIDMSLLFVQFSKILLEAVFPDRKYRYLMINVIEKDLEILKSETIKDDCTKVIKLINRKCFKLLYKVEEDEVQPLLKFWQTDINVQSIRLSHRLFLSIVQILNDNSNVIPKMYRYNNGFIFSYVFYPT